MFLSKPSLNNKNGEFAQANAGQAVLASMLNSSFSNTNIGLYIEFSYDIQIVKSDGVTGGWRKLHNEELHNLYSSPSIIRIIKSRRMSWAGHVARMGGEEEHVYVIGGKARGKETTRKTET
jgi:hypothetical protein